MVDRQFVQARRIAEQALDVANDDRTAAEQLIAEAEGSEGYLEGVNLDLTPGGAPHEHPVLPERIGPFKGTARHRSAPKKNGGRMDNHETNGRARTGDPTKTRRLKRTITVVLALVATGANAGPPDIQTILDERVEAGLAPGIVVGMLHDDGSTEFISAGTLQAGGTTMVDEHTIFEIGSITKIFTTLIAARMEENELLSLDDPVQQYLPAKIKVPEKDGQTITLRHLATHTSSLPRLPDNFHPADPANPYADYTPERMYAFLGDHDLADPPGTGPAYSNLGMGLLGHALELRADKPYEDLVQAEVCEPLNMTSTSCRPRPQDASRVASAHRGLQPVVAWDFSAMAGCGDINSTATDMLTFAAANMGQNKSPLHEAMRKCQTPVVPGQGLGWGIGYDAKGKRVTHGGGTGGFASYLCVLPDSGEAVIVLANSSYRGVDQIGQHALNGEYPLDLLPPKAAALDEFLGVFQLGATGPEFTITREERQLMARLSGQEAVPVYLAGGDRFEYRVVKAELTFGRNRSGKINRLVLHQNGRHQEALKRPTQPQTSHHDDYTGTYRMALGREFSVKDDRGNLAIRLSGQRQLPVVQVGRDRFEYKDIEAQVSFLRDADGSVNRLVLHQNDAHIEAAKKP
jgi:CubicO group peptidase (beta-lactamase class C family)